jgi:hypothetical protein
LGLTHPHLQGEYTEKKVVTELHFPSQGTSLDVCVVEWKATCYVDVNQFLLGSLECAVRRTGAFATCLTLFFGSIINSMPGQMG